MNKKARKQVSKKNKKKTNVMNWLPIICFVLLALLIFYPPYCRGLFFNTEMFITHIITAVIFIIVWLEKILHKDYNFIQTPLDWAILAYVGAYLLSLSGAIHIGEAVNGFLRALNYFMIYWMVTQVVKTYKDYENILKVLVISGLGVAFIGILTAVGLSDYPHGFERGMIMSTLQYPNTTAAYLAILSLIVVTLWIKEDKFIIKMLYGLSGYIMLLVVLCTLSKGAWLILAIGGVLLFIGVSGINKLKAIYSMSIMLIAAVITYFKFYTAIISNAEGTVLLYLLIGAIVIICGLFIWEGFTILYRRKGNIAIYGTIVLLCLTFSIGIIKITNSTPDIVPGNIIGEIKELKDFSNSSYTSRYDFIRWGMAIIKDHPLVGTGAGGWNALYHQYQDELLWTKEVHNHFVQVWVEAGTVGFLAFVSIWCITILFLVRLKRSLFKNDDKCKQEQWILIWGTATAALTLGIHATIDFDLSLAAMCILLWTLIALINVAYKWNLSTSDKETIYKNNTNIILA